MFEVIPGILEKDWKEIERKIERVKPFVNTIHIDLAEGKFVNNTTFQDPEPFRVYTDELFFELHMMVEEPINYLDKWAASGFKRFLGHVEKMSSQAEFIAKGQLLGEVGLALDGPTVLDKLTTPFLDLDAILIYTTSHAGFSGPEFDPTRLEKIKTIRARSNIPIEVDGGINEKTIVDAKDVGATRFVSTSFIFESPNIENAINQLRNAIA